MSKRLHFAMGPRGITISFAAVALMMPISCDDDDSTTDGTGGETGAVGGYGTTGGKTGSGGTSATGTKATGGMVSLGGTTSTTSAAKGGSLSSGGSGVAGSGMGGSGVAGSGMGGSAGTLASGGASTTVTSAVAGTGAAAGATAWAGAAGAAAASFTSLYDNVLTARCLPCHATGAGVSVGMLDLSTRAQAFTALLGSNGTGAPAMGTSPGSAQATCASVPNLLRVHPGNATTSLLWQKVSSKLLGTNPPCGNPMPPGSGAALTQQQVNDIAAWINRGAPND